MSTRLWPQNAAPSYTPPTLRGNWQKTTGFSTLKLGRAKAGTRVSKAQSENSATNPYNVLLFRAVSEPVAAMTLSGTVSYVYAGLRDSASAAFNCHIHIFATVGDTDTVRGSILADDVSGSTWPANLAGVGKLNAAIASLALTDGDRIVTEWGFRSTNTSTNTITGTSSYGGTASDYVLGTQSSSASPWVEFSADIADYVPPSGDPAVRQADMLAFF